LKGKRVVKEGISFWLVGPYHTRTNFEDQDVIQPLLVMGTCDDSCHHVFFQLQGIRVLMFSLHLDGNSLLTRASKKKRGAQGEKNKNKQIIFFHYYLFKYSVISISILIFISKIFILINLILTITRKHKSKKHEKIYICD